MASPKGLRPVKEMNEIYFINELSELGRSPHSEATQGRSNFMIDRK